MATVHIQVGPVPYDTDVYEVTKEAARQARLTGLAPSGPRSASATPGTPSAGTSGTRTGASTPAGRSTPVGGARSSGAASAASTPRGGAQKPWPGAVCLISRVADRKLLAVPVSLPSYASLLAELGVLSLVSFLQQGGMWFDRGPRATRNKSQPGLQPLT